MKDLFMITKRHEPSFENEYTEVHYNDGRLSTDSMGVIKLPKWLTELIKWEKEISYRAGKMEIQQQIRDILEIK